MSDIQDVIKRITKASESIYRDHSEGPVCVGVHKDLGIPFSDIDRMKLPDEVIEKLDSGEYDEQEEAVRLDLAPEHVEFHELMQSLSVGTLNVAGSAQGAMMLMFSLGRRVGLMESAETFTTSGLGDGPLLLPEGFGDIDTSRPFLDEIEGDDQ